ncbi:carboxypeptidase-like regulatory domain-containing protein [uncultured Winogradskyella sp.]|uniref:carboxypeptidase-like regulatory domain-containing protein n=1 Tax=uncultured Winogradskyella sp. TaxID=395353 RepID=UPI0026328843|nr:carboxypeptidase-like regulatory domain-containing protein [uncultured Winogradskyella sp.]
MKKIAFLQNGASNKVLLLMGFLFLATFLCNPLQAQSKSITVKGIVNSEIGPLEGVSIYLKNSKTGTVSKADGSFTFPSQLKAGDVLIFSYLGYDKQSIIITETSTYLDIFMKEAPIDVLSAVNNNKRYKSKRPKKS